MKSKGKLGLMIITVCILLVFTISVVFVGCTKPAPAPTPTPPSAPAPAPAPTPTPTPAPTSKTMGDLIAFHQDLTKIASAQCISCHGNKAEEKSLNPDIKTPHAIHIPMLKECNTCHKKADLLEGSAATLRKQVDPQVCNSCHGPNGTGPQLYQVEPTLSD